MWKVSGWKNRDCIINRDFMDKLLKMTDSLNSVVLKSIEIDITSKKKFIEDNIEYRKKKNV